LWKKTKTNSSLLRGLVILKNAHGAGKTKDEAKAEYIAKTTQIREDL
jgi:hypothetical protein